VHLVGFIIRIYHDARSPERHVVCRRETVFGVTFVYFYKELPDDGRMAEICFHEYVTTTLYIGHVSDV